MPEITLSAAQIETIVYARQEALKSSKNGTDECYSYSIKLDEGITVEVVSDVAAVEGAIVGTCGPSFYIFGERNGPYDYIRVPMR